MVEYDAGRFQARVDNLVTRADKTDERLDDLDKRQSAQETQTATQGNSQRWVIGILAVLVGLVFLNTYYTWQLATYFRVLP